MIPNVGAVTHTQGECYILASMGEHSQRGTDITAFGGKFGYCSIYENGFRIMTIHSLEDGCYKSLISEQTAQRVTE